MLPEHPASAALRARSPELLRHALLADVVGGAPEWRRDARDMMVALAPYHDCATRLGLDPAAEFRRAADAGPPDLRDTVTTFGARTDITAPAFGFALVDGPDGPSYRYAWADSR